MPNSPENSREDIAPRRVGAIFLHALPDGHIPIDSAIINNILYVATSEGVYAYYGGQFRRIEFDKPVEIAKDIMLHHTLRQKP